MKNCPQLLVFDCDGVLFDSREANRAYYEDICRALGRPPLTEEELRYVHMHTAEESVRYLFRDLPEKLEEALAYQRTLPYEKFLCYMKLEPGLKEFLEWARGRFHLAISTNRTTTMGRLLEIYGLEPFFDLVMTALKSPKPKPHPEALTVILEHFGVAPEETLYIGDSEVDLQLCRSVGVPLAAYKNPSLPADLHLQSYEDLRRFLSALPKKG
ncbi:HAD family hydrolase [Thermosulfurimonas marina]|uniref:phosphoglycolate phosphatase n=1 Tax=Thermosulfurimonas marina TaxID=2047767 RepID=A0A6H1WQQ6_9BACT|nr:HAD family hydrolase [Thermosulfurimonas marina]QJA05490.1 HAD family hydrolase [Thermosulfurimonas marina]